MGKIYEQLEYTPYGELWVEHLKTTIEAMPFRFTGKERDSETGLYYFGARYLNPQTSMWLSADPAMGEYVTSPGTKMSDLPGMGGIYNTINFHSFAYAGNNPVNLTDPNGRDIGDLTASSSQARIRYEEKRNYESQSRMTPHRVNEADKKVINAQPALIVNRSPRDNENNGNYYESRISLVNKDDIIATYSVQSTADDPDLNNGEPDKVGSTLPAGIYGGTLINTGYKYALQIKVVGGLGTAKISDAYAVHPDVFTGTKFRRLREEAGKFHHGPFGYPGSLGCQIMHNNDFNEMLNHLDSLGISLNSKMNIRIVNPQQRPSYKMLP
jgi:RHS repeat-associated protein